MFITFNRTNSSFFKQANKASKYVKEIFLIFYQAPRKSE